MPRKIAKSNQKTAIVVFLLTILVAAYWLTSLFMNVYDNKTAGAIWELLWLPMILLIFLLPVFSLIQWFMHKFSVRSLWLYSAIIGSGTLMYSLTH